MMIDAIVTLLAFAFLSAGTPGPNNLMLMASGMNYGFRRSAGHMTGVAYGFPLMIVAVGLGLSQLFQVVPVLETVLKIACAVYLIYLAYRIATARPKVTGDGAVEVSGRPLTFFQAAAFQWVNPKAWVMATTALTVWTALGDRLRLFFQDPLRLRLFNGVAAGLLLLTLVPVFWPELL